MCVWSPPTRTYIELFLMVFALKEPFFLFNLLCNLYTISFGVWFHKINQDESGLVGSNSDESCPQGILVKLLLKSLYAKDAWYSLGNEHVYILACLFQTRMEKRVEESYVRRCWYMQKGQRSICHDWPTSVATYD